MRSVAKDHISVFRVEYIYGTVRPCVLQAGDLSPSTAIHGENDL